MNDSDELLTLPVEGDDPGRAPPRGCAPVGAASASLGSPASRVTELVSLSSEARLATALLLQAQALEGMRQAHTDLLRRVADGGAAGGAGHHGVEDWQSALKAVQAAQQQALRQLGQARRRARRRSLLVAALIVLALAGTGWFVFRLRDELRASFADLRGQVTDQAQAGRAALQQSLQASLAQAVTDQDRALDELAATLQDTELVLRGKLDETAAGRDAALSALASERQVTGELRAELTAQQARSQARELDLERTRDQHVEQIGDNTRLRGLVADRDRRLDELTLVIADLREQQAARAAAPDGRIVVSQGQGAQSLAARVSAALRNSGAAGTQVLEAGEVRDGLLRDLLVMRAEESGQSPRLVRAALGELLVENGLALLRLGEVRAQGADGPSSSEDIPLPALDAAAWRAAGLSPPRFVPLPTVTAALSALLAPHGYTIVGLQSFDGETMGGLELRHADADGRLLRTLKAARAVLHPVGPELELQDGSIVTDGDERPFFHGVYELALPGADFGQWLAAVSGPPQ